MSVVRVTREVETVGEAIAALNEQVLHTVSRRRMDQQDLVRVEVKLRPFDILKWLASQRSTTKYYWRDRETGVEYGGIGAVESVTIVNANDLNTFVERIGRQDADSPFRWIGGLPFDFMRPRSVDNFEFGVGRFILPGIEAKVTKETATLACNVTIQDSNLYSRLACLSEIDPTVWTYDLPATIIERRESPARELWKRTIQDTLEQIRSGVLTKLVPARKVTLELSSPLDPWRTVSRLKAQGGALTLFAIQLDENSAFLGATPERLFKRHGRILESEAIAGTTVRGSNAQQDADHSDKLLTSDKDRREHQLVVDYVRDALEPFSDSLALGNTGVLKLPQLQHLRTSIRASLRGSVTDADLLEVLHPTPAVAGVPKELSMQLIRESEPFDRGWYAGAVGWLHRDSSEFAVAIRSLLISGDQLTLFAGAGIVDGSDPDAEWEETEQKIRSSLDIILP